MTVDKKRTVAIGFAFLLLLFIVAITFFLSNIRRTAEIVDWQFVHIRNDLEIWKMLGGSNDELRRRVAVGIVGKLMVVRTLSPNIRKLKAPALESLCFLAGNEGKSIFQAADDPVLVQVAREYVLSVHSEVQRIILNVQEIRGGVGCYINAGAKGMPS